MWCSLRLSFLVFSAAFYVGYKVQNPTSARVPMSALLPGQHSLLATGLWSVQPGERRKCSRFYDLRSTQAFITEAAKDSRCSQGFYWVKGADVNPKPRQGQKIHCSTDAPCGGAGFRSLACSHFECVECCKRHGENDEGHVCILATHQPKATKKRGKKKTINSEPPAPSSFAPSMGDGLFVFSAQSGTPTIPNTPTADGPFAFSAQSGTSTAPNTPTKSEPHGRNVSDYLNASSNSYYPPGFIQASLPTQSISGPVLRSPAPSRIARDQSMKGISVGWCKNATDPPLSLLATAPNLPIFRPWECTLIARVANVELDDLKEFCVVVNGLWTPSSQPWRIDLACKASLPSEIIDLTVEETLSSIHSLFPSDPAMKNAKFWEYYQLRGAEKGITVAEAQTRVFGYKISSSSWSRHYSPWLVDNGLTGKNYRPLSFTMSTNPLSISPLSKKLNANVLNAVYPGTLSTILTDEDLRGLASALVTTGTARPPRLVNVPRSTLVETIARSRVIYRLQHMKNVRLFSDRTHAESALSKLLDARLLEVGSAVGSYLSLLHIVLKSFQEDTVVVFDENPQVQQAEQQAQQHEAPQGQQPQPEQQEPENHEQPPEGIPSPPVRLLLVLRDKDTDYKIDKQNVETAYQVPCSDPQVTFLEVASAAIVHGVEKAVLDNNDWNVSGKSYRYAAADISDIAYSHLLGGLYRCSHDCPEPCPGPANSFLDLLDAKEIGFPPDAPLRPVFSWFESAQHSKYTATKSWRVDVDNGTMVPVFQLKLCVSRNPPHNVERITHSAPLKRKRGRKEPVVQGAALKKRDTQGPIVAEAITGSRTLQAIRDAKENKTTPYPLPVLLEWASAFYDTWYKTRTHLNKRIRIPVWQGYLLHEADWLRPLAKIGKIMKDYNTLDLGCQQALEKQHGEKTKTGSYTYPRVSPIAVYSTLCSHLKIDPKKYKLDVDATYDDDEHE
ncbi:hypothetical protein GGX14DRAFT_385197 [Mycena pura]|uniref:Uncharacterized protein n=1 Tax=Mycena pura TaxID=153505 RepID=A0AAD7E5H9_9AGAR|nr:hypothetical protein GGX14DRAFT_385197 [Mycena pura]